MDIYDLTVLLEAEENASSMNEHRFCLWWVNERHVSRVAVRRALAQRLGLLRERMFYPEDVYRLLRRSGRER